MAVLADASNERNLGAEDADPDDAVEDDVAVEEGDPPHAGMTSAPASRVMPHMLHMLITLSFAMQHGAGGRVGRHGDRHHRTQRSGSGLRCR